MAIFYPFKCHVAPHMMAIQLIYKHELGKDSDNTNAKHTIQCFVVLLYVKSLYRVKQFIASQLLKSVSLREGTNASQVMPV